MRKLILASALLLASASAHAGEIKGLGLAANDAPVVAVADTARPLPPLSASETPRQRATEPARPLSSRPSRQVQAGRYGAIRYGAREAKARRIAARYGIIW